jgi:predicted PurR-regulated permease PerM
VATLASDVDLSIQRYTAMKVVISVATAAVRYVILVLVGLDFAAIWALIALLQFDTITAFLIVAVLLGGTQVTFGNVI